MQIKKRYFVVALALLLGLTTVTFANPLEKMDSKKTAKGISERVINDRKENNSYSEALEAVEVAEENPTVETVETARNEIRNADDATEEQVQNLEQRVNVAEETIDVAALVKEVETLAEVKETRETAKEKYTNAETEVNKLEEGEVKTNLTLRLTKVSKFLNDTTKPKITGITNGSVVNKSENIYVSDEFLYNVKITGPNSKGEVVTKEFTEKDFTIDENNETYTMKHKANYEGKWTVVATDKLGNTTTETFTIDRTKAKRVYSTVRVNKKEYEENKTKYYYVKNGDSFEFAISFTEMLAQAPTVTIGGRNVEMKLNEKVLKNENKFLYEGTFEIPANEKELKQGTLEIKVSNVKDLAGNVSTSEIVTNQTVTSNGRTVIYDCKNPVVTGVNNKYYYTTPITIKAVDYVVHNVSPIATATIDGKEYELGTEYSKEGTHEFVAYDRAGNRLRATFTIDYTAPTLKIKSESVGVDPYYNSISFKLSDNIMIDYYVINGKKVDVTNNKYGDANYGNIKNNLVTGQNTIELYDAAGHKTVKTFNIAKNTAKVEEGNVTVNEDIYLVNEPFYNDIETEKEVVINGNGKTVTQYITSADKLQWKGNHKTPNGLNIPLLGDVFSSKNGAKVTVNNITFTGTIHSIMLGNYEDSSSNWFNTEFNNVNIINTKVVSLAGNIAPAAVVYGKATLNNVNIYGTTRSELENAPDDPYWPIYDLGLVNYSNTTLNGGKIGSIYMWKHAKLTVKAGTTVDSIDITLGTPAANIVVEEGATVNKIITKDGEMEYDEWLAQTNFTTVNNVEQFKKALAEGYKKIIIASTLNINENQKFSAKSKTFVTTQGTITMFDVKEGNTLTLEKLVLDGENKYKVDVTKAAEMHNDPYNLFNKYPLEQTRIYENTPLIKTAGTLTLGNGTVIRNYAHQPKNGANKQQYGGPAILVTGGQTTIDGLEFTNNVSQLLTAKNATITINNINVHDTWADGNKAGLIEINADATMDVNNGTFKNNMMSMRSYGLFIANAGTINMKGGIYENNYSTRNGSNTAGSLFGVETTGKIYMTSGTVQNNIGYRAGAFATRWATDGSVIELNGGTIKNNTTRDSAFKNAAIFVQSNVKIGTNMVVEDKVVLRGATAMLDHNGKIVGDVELVDNLGKFNNNGTVTGTIIVPEV